MIIIFHNLGFKQTHIYNKRALDIIKYSISETINLDKLTKVKVALIDEGITRQPSLKFIKLRDNKENEVPSHGTIITNLLAAHLDDTSGYEGLIPDMPLYGYSLSVDEMDTSSLVKAIETVISWNVDIISISMGTNKSDNNLENVIQKAVNQGIVIVCSAGNDAYEENYPASFNIPGVVSVGAIGNDYNILNNSNVNSQIDIYAPGETIASFTNNSLEIHEYSGTSVSVPFVTMACIYIKAYNNSIKPEEIESFLLQHTSTYLAKWRNNQRVIKLLDMADLMKSLE